MKKKLIENKKLKKQRILKQTLPGRLAARNMGKLGGRPKKLNSDKIKIAIDLYTKTLKPITEICKELGISRPTFYPYLRNKHKINEVDCSHISI